MANLSLISWIPLLLLLRSTWMQARPTQIETCSSGWTACEVSSGECDSIWMGTVHCSYWRSALYFELLKTIWSRGGGVTVQHEKHNHFKTVTVPWLQTPPGDYDMSVVKSPHKVYVYPRRYSHRTSPFRTKSQTCPARHSCSLRTPSFANFRLPRRDGISDLGSTLLVCWNGTKT